MSDNCEYCGLTGQVRGIDREILAPWVLELRPAPHVEGVTVIACIDRTACDERCLPEDDD